MSLQMHLKALEIPRTGWMEFCSLYRIDIPFKQRVLGSAGVSSFSADFEKKKRTGYQGVLEGGWDGDGWVCSKSYAFSFVLLDSELAGQREMWPIPQQRGYLWSILIDKLTVSLVWKMSRLYWFLSIRFTREKLACAFVDGKGGACLRVPIVAVSTFEE